MSADKHPESIPALLASLRTLRDTNPKAIRANVHIYPSSLYANNGESSKSGAADANSRESKLRDRKITSWKMTEHMYFNAQNPFPTLARGLFTEEVQDGDPLPNEVASGGEGRQRPNDRIVARGYDKFFNIDEVEWTIWSAMQKYTEPPYHLTLKSNGCLILISALSPTHLIVASKHSLGTTTESQEKEAEAKAHAAVGREWVKKTLVATGKTEAQLARKLWDNNTTAVLELCDDSFEEHVIATPAHWTGLHLHGLNHNTPHFSTSSPAEVTSFAKEFGFIQTKYVELQTLDEVKSFTDEVAKTGSWEGDMIEGFVVRCKVKSSINDAKEEGKPPYKAGAPFFFKVKFDEPYLLYRQWREITRVMLPLLNKYEPEDISAIWKKVRTKTKRPEIGVYAEWVGNMIKSEPELFNDYDKGVVRVRERFLEWIERPEGKKLWEDARSGKSKKVLGQTEKQVSKEGLPKKYLIVPIAVPGCGKTLMGVALSKLFGFGHTQSDDVTTKRTAPTFIKNITALLQKEDIVYADRNNHIPKHYEELAAITSSKAMQKYDVRLIGIVWDISSQPYHRLLRICSERVVSRGDNHQTLRPDPTVDAEHEAVVGQFLRNFTSPDPALFDNLIDVQVLHSPKEALVKIANGLVPLVDLPKPSEEDLENALDYAVEYKINTPYHAIAKVGKPIRYFGLAPEIDLNEIVENIIQVIQDDSIKTSAQSIFEEIKNQNRITAKPHITLSHEKNVSIEAEELANNNKNQNQIGTQKKLWDRCRKLAEMKFSILFKFDIKHLIWDNRIMTLSIKNLQPILNENNSIDQQKEKKENENEDELGLNNVLPEDVKNLLHITVGTKNEEISAFESRGLMNVLNSFNGGDKGEIDEIVEGGGKVRWIKIEGVQGEGRVKGMY
ncbi:uncharacterized protein I206_104816 [Kwoniella pini CBS 10737]|uniref:tRNA ligase n=1 Tax=Kwoniella pini CBS 10737 TaxID=1296096 RepID=A0A1B9I7V0_9TREE|nr:uncharacterized protein I206_02355 [Kwoniella pini CBS 10737]OCF51640.1 hypothetical protein I206_02355 [Kwoniella pini CBS 10737]